MKKNEFLAWLKSWDAGEFDFTAALPKDYTDPNANAGNTDHPWKLEPINRLEEGEMDVKTIRDLTALVKELNQLMKNAGEDAGESLVRVQWSEEAQAWSE